jgi:hypothetical protein
MRLEEGLEKMPEEETKTKDVQATRRQFARLSRDIVQGMHRKDMMQVITRPDEQGQTKQFDFEIHALTEVTILERAEKSGLTLADLIKTQPADVENPDPKTLAKMRFLDEIIAAAQVGQDLSPEDLRTALPASERARLFARILDISGLGPKTTETLEKFRSRQVAGPQ